LREYAKLASFHIGGRDEQFRNLALSYCFEVHKPLNEVFQRIDRTSILELDKSALLWDRCYSEANRKEYGRFASRHQKAGWRDLAQIGTRRKAFEEAIRGQQPESDAAWAKAKTTLEADWASFEAAVEDYVKNSALPSQEGVKLFRARAEAQGKAWEETISALKKRQR
jgi:hypothetical protein